MFQKYIISIYGNIDACLSDCEDIIVINSKKNAYTIEDAFGNKMTLRRENNNTVTLTATESSDPCFVLYFLIIKRKAKIMPFKVYKLLTEDGNIKKCQSLYRVWDFNFTKITNAFVKDYENLVYWSPQNRHSDYLVNAIIGINQSANQEENRRKVPAALEIKRLPVYPN
jgi:hypothetical protein